MEYSLGLRERKKWYVLGRVLGLGDGGGEDIVVLGVFDLNFGGFRDIVLLFLG